MILQRLTNNEWISTSIEQRLKSYALQKFGGKGLCCDTIHETTYYDFNLNSLLVLDKFEEGVLVASCLSNRDNFAFMKLFFSKICDNAGAISPCWFVEWDGPLISNPSPPPSSKVIYLCHVEKSRKEQLYDNVKSFESQTVIHKYLRIALEQTDLPVFDRSVTLTNIRRRKMLKARTRKSDFANQLKKKRTIFCNFIMTKILKLTNWERLVIIS